MSNWAVDFAAAFKPPGSSESASETGMAFAKVETTEPLTITTWGQTISQNLYINPALVWKSEELPQVFAQEPDCCPACKTIAGFLKEFHKRYVLKSGDDVVVYRMGAAFYVLAKAVRQ